MPVLITKRFYKFTFDKYNELKIFNEICKQITDEVVGLYKNVNEKDNIYNKYVSEEINNYTHIVFISPVAVHFYSYSFNDDIYNDIYDFNQRGVFATIIFEIKCTINNENKISISYISHKHTNKNISEKLENNIIRILYKIIVSITKISYC